MVGPLPPLPASGRTFSARRRIRLSDMDVGGRLRLDAIARYLQDVATDDVAETGWGAPDHLWVIRRIRVDVQAPFLADRELELTTWCSGMSALAAGRRTSLAGDRGGRVEVDSVWIHLGPDARPARLAGFGPYEQAASGVRVSTKVDLPELGRDVPPVPWPLRRTDVDVLGHVNNAAYWAAVEERLPSPALDPRRPFRALLDYGQAIDVEDEIALVDLGGPGLALAFVADGTVVKAAARLLPVATS